MNGELYIKLHQPQRLVMECSHCILGSSYVIVRHYYIPTVLAGVELMYVPILLE
jgi:hypothetical protein